MHAIILHEIGVKTSDIREGLTYHNFKIESRQLGSAGSRSKLFDTEAVIIVVDSSRMSTFLERVSKEIGPSRNHLTSIVIDALYSEETAEKGRALGFDLYAAKPIHYRDIAMKIKNTIFKKHGTRVHRWLRAFDVQLDLEHRFVCRRGSCMKLRNKEFDLLEFFIMNRGKLLTRTSIFEHVWDRNASFSSNTIDVHVNRLRKKIDDPFRKKLIHTMHSIGYIFDLTPGL